MPAHKKEHTTPETNQRTSESSASRMPTQEDFHQYLRSQIRQATRVVMEEVMREELERFVGAAWGEMLFLVRRMLSKRRMRATSRQ